MRVVHCIPYIETGRKAACMCVQLPKLCPLAAAEQGARNGSYKLAVASFYMFDLASSASTINFNLHLSAL